MKKGVGSQLIVETALQAAVFDSKVGELQVAPPATCLVLLPLG